MSCQFNHHDVKLKYDQDVYKMLDIKSKAFVRLFLNFSKATLFQPEAVYRESKCRSIFLNKMARAFKVCLHCV